MLRNDVELCAKASSLSHSGYNSSELLGAHVRTETKRLKPGTPMRPWIVSASAVTPSLLSVCVIPAIPHFTQEKS